MKPGLTIAAEDADDLEIISAQLQDAVARVKDLVYLPKSRRFAAVFNRFKWEDAEKFVVTEAVVRGEESLARGLTPSDVDKEQEEEAPAAPPAQTGRESA